MKEKNYQLEVLRVISCINVILIHVCNIYSRSFGSISDVDFVFATFLNCMARTSVPIFFMISGATSLNRVYDTKKYLSKICGIGGTLLASSLFYYFWNLILFKRSYNFLDFFETPVKAHLWYLYAFLGHDVNLNDNRYQNNLIKEFNDSLK